MKVNYHTHTCRCLHAQGAEKDYLQNALDAGLTILGFSDHAPFPDRDFGLRMSCEELDDYLETLDDLKCAHSGDIRLLKGLEIEYLPEYRDYYEMLFEKKQLDYLLLGEHFYRIAPDSIANIYHASDTDCYLKYASAIAEALKTGYFKILAHPDLYLINPFAWDRNCDAAADIILNAAAQNNVILEFNANGLRRGIHDFPDGRRYSYPDDRFWKKVCGSNIPVLVGSDCHNPTQVWDSAVEDAYAHLREIGIEPVFEF